MTRLNPTLVISLLLHLAVLYAAGALMSRGGERRETVPGDLVAYLDLRGDREQGAAAALRRDATSGPVTGRKREAESPPAPAAIPAPPPSVPARNPAALTPPPLPVTSPALPAVSASAGAPANGAAARKELESGTADRSGAPRPDAGSGMARAGRLQPGAATAKDAQGGGNSGTPSLRGGAYQAQLKRLIEAHKEYPLAARKAGVEGSCQRRFLLGPDGALKRVETVSSCGHPFLDTAATRAISTVGAFPPPPAEFAGSEEPFSVTITFTLARR